jgi:LacI family transcriptional regulator
MPKKITIKDVALASGCSVGTVSHVLNGREGVKPGSTAAILAAIERLGYKPDAIARGMRTGQTRVVAMVARDFTNPLFHVVMQSVERELERAGYTLLVVNTKNRLSREIDLVHMLIDRRVDGLILSPGGDDGADLVKAATRANVPVVALDREMPAPADRVMSDHAKGVRTATRYLLELGHRRIALMTGSLEIFTARSRVAGYVDAMREAGIGDDGIEILAGSFDREYGAFAAESLLTRDRPPTAIICGGVPLLLGLLPIVSERQIHIPEALSIVCCDDCDVARLYRPAITIVNRNLDHVGEHAAALLIQRLQGQRDTAPRTIYIGTEVVLRDSCARPNR